MRREITAKIPNFSEYLSIGGIDTRKWSDEGDFLTNFFNSANPYIKFCAPSKSGKTTLAASAAFYQCLYKPESNVFFLSDLEFRWAYEKFNFLHRKLKYEVFNEGNVPGFSLIFDNGSSIYHQKTEENLEDLLVDEWDMSIIDVPYALNDFLSIFYSSKKTIRTHPQIYSNPAILSLKKEDFS